MTEDQARDIVLALVNAVARNPSIEDDDLAKSLMETGYEFTDAELAVAIVPSVFGRLALRRLGAMKFSPYFTVTNHHGRSVRYDLRSHPIYRAAARIAAATEVHGFLTKEQFSPVGGRSAECDAASRLLDSGAKLEGVVFSDLAVIRITAEDVGPKGRVRWWHRFTRRA
jgi:hypothetical protein